MSILPFVFPFVGSAGSIDAAGALPSAPENKVTLPWALNPANSWLDYRAWLEVVLDAGMVLHKPLPQQASPVDTLGSVDMDDGGMDKAQGGVALTGSGVVDVVQRMATSTYTFALRGFGLRVGYQVPIPRLRSVAGVTPIPAEVQRAYNMIVGNFCGVPVWYAQWDLHYYLPSSPGQRSPGQMGQGQTNDAPVPYNPALHIRPDAELPEGLSFPASQSDQNSVPTAGNVFFPGK